jgi:ABC-type amino acid transport substrate-binding protein
LLSAALLAACSKKEDNKLYSIADLSTANLCVLSGGIYDQLFEHYYPKAHKIVVPTMPDLPKGIEEGRCDGGFVDYGQAQGILANHPLVGMLQDTVKEWITDIAFGFQKTDTAYIRRFDRYLTQLQANGELARIINGWMQSADTMPVLSVPAAGPDTLRLGSAIEEPPITYIRKMGDKETYAGYDLDLVFRFAQTESLTVSLVRLPYDQLIPTLARGGLDMVANNFSITPQRNAIIAFSRPYKPEPVSVLALKSRIGR